MARTTARAQTRANPRRLSQTSTPRHRPSWVSRSIVEQFCQIRIDLWRPGLEDHGPHDLASRLVAQGVRDPGVRVAAFAPQRDPAVNLVEMRSPADQLADSLGCFPDHHLDDLEVAQSLAGGQRVGDMVVELVFRVEDPGDSPLGVVAVALADLVLGHDEGPELIGNAKRPRGGRQCRRR